MTTSIQPLQNAVNSIGIDGLKITSVFQEDKRKTVEKFVLTIKGNSESPVLNYENMQHFLLGMHRVKQLIKTAAI